MQTSRPRLNLQEIEDLLELAQDRYIRLLSFAKSYGRINKERNPMVYSTLKRSKRLIRKLQKAKERLINPQLKTADKERDFFIISM